MIRVLQRIPTRRIPLLRPLSTAASNNTGKPTPPPPTPPPTIAGGEEDGVVSREEAYRRIHDLDFMTAVKILVTTPPKRKQFGLDFHLVQLIFACLPSLAVYLVAQYARHEIRRMEAEAELKKKRAEEEQKAKEAELISEEDLPADSDLSKVIVRLDALEEVVKEIVDEKKRTFSESKKDPVVTGNDSDPRVKSAVSEPKTDSDKEKQMAGD